MQSAEVDSSERQFATRGRLPGQISNSFSSTHIHSYRLCGPAHNVSRTGSLARDVGGSQRHSSLTDRFVLVSSRAPWSSSCD